MRVKNSAITYTGYEYQTLFGVLKLATWLNNPTEYECICFEADQEDTPQGIDDIVLKRNDGKIDYIQVKFTPSEHKTENAFNWTWLLKVTGRTARSRSILKKIYDAVQAVDDEKQGKIILITNKIPDREIEACLIKEKFNYDLISPEAKALINEQLGSEQESRDFFEILQVKDSQKSYTSLQNEVKEELSKHSNDEGIYRLKDIAREWAKFRDYPSEDGWIELHHIREVLSIKRPKPILQSFLIPDNYCLPNKEFHDSIFKRITTSEGTVISITGEPGKGKSTYLSYLYQELEENSFPVIRHHYFLSMQDKTQDRLNFGTIAESLFSQIKSKYKDIELSSKKPEHLSSTLEECAKYYKSEGKPFILIIDGLDHVWRDNQKDIKPLESIFKELLPVCENLILIVGTQPIDDNQLPKTLLHYSPKKEWFYLPFMSGDSIFEYLNYQINASRLFLNVHEDRIEEELTKISKDLLEITSGYPLHVIYSCEFLSLSGDPLSTWKIKELPPCDSTSIESYYKTLWQNLNHKQRDILHLCSEFSFIWPRNAFPIILQDSGNEPSLKAVLHLLYQGKSGVRPFHESLVVFVKKQEEHNERVSTLIEKVCTWIEEDASEYLNQTYKWLCKSQSGNSQPLREGITREWVIKRLSEGYDSELIIPLFKEAETLSFNELNFPEAYAHRALKIRLINGPQFQTWKFPLLKVLSFYNSPQSLIDTELTQYQNYTPKDLAILSIALWNRGDKDNAKLVAEYAITVYKSQDKLNKYINRDDETPEVIIEAGVLSNSLNYNKLFNENKFITWEEKNIRYFLDACIKKLDVSLLIRAFDNISEYQIANQFELSLLRMSIIEDFDIFSWEEFELGHNLSISQVLKLLRRGNLKTHVDEGPFYADNSLYKLSDSINYHEWFFDAVEIKLKATGDFSWLSFQSEEEKESIDISFYLNTLTELASNAVDHLLLKDNLDFYTCSALLNNVSFPKDKHSRDRRAEILFKREWLKISADFHMLVKETPIEIVTFKEVIDLKIYLTDWLRLWYKNIILNVLSDDAAELLIEEELNKQSSELEETIERSNANLELSSIAFRHNNEELFKKCLILSWEYVIGYGHHKDVTIFNVLNSIDYISEDYPSEALSFLKRISSIVYNISNFTDGDETGHALNEMNSLLAKLSPGTLASKYNQEILDGEWYEGEGSLKGLLKESDFNSVSEKALCLTGLGEDVNDIVVSKARESNAEAIQIVEKLSALLNYDITEETAEILESSSTSNPEEDIDISTYPPDKIYELDKATQGLFGLKDFWLKWYNYWVKNGEEQALTTMLPEYLSSLEDKFYKNPILYDCLFHSIKKLKGKREAFQYLVSAHIYMRGWSNYHGAESTLERLNHVGTFYKYRVNEFIAKTTIHIDKWIEDPGSLIIPNDNLVYLLVKSNKKEEALSLTKSIVKSLEDDTRNLILEEPNWDWDDNQNIEEIFINMLISRLKWPIPTVKVWVIQQLAELLIQLPSLFESKIAEALSLCNLESECIELLSIFLMAKDLGYVPEIEIGEYINARSTLSDMVISELGLTKNGNYSTEFYFTILLSGNNNNFDQVQGEHVPLVYSSRLRELEKDTGFPLTDYYKSEWNRTFEYDSNTNDSYSYFMNSNRENTGQFYTITSHRGRSAYLRVLEIAKLYYGMPASYAENLATLALPIEPLFNNLKPVKPKWISNWTYGENISSNNLAEFIQTCSVNLKELNEDNELAAISFPSKVNDNIWLDITIVKALYREEEEVTNISLKERNNALAIGEGLNQYITYSSFENEGKKNYVQLTGLTYPVARYGHFYSDLESRGIYVPLPYDENKYIVLIQAEQKLNFLLNGTTIGETSYWYYRWASTHPKGIDSLCASYTLLSKSNINSIINHKYKEWKEVFICEITILSREHSYGEFKKDKNIIIVDV